MRISVCLFFGGKVVLKSAAFLFYAKNKIIFSEIKN